MLSKIDKRIYAAMTAYVRRWVKKQKFQKHKFDFLIKVEKIEIGLWIAGIGWAVVRAHNVVASVPLALLGLLVVWLAYGSLRHTERMKEAYDILFMHRKHPEIYQAVKEAMEAGFAENSKRRHLYFVVNLLFFALNITLNPLFAAMILSHTFNSYILWVFDFDEPDKKEKEKKEALTEVMQRAFNDLVRGLAPVPTS